MSTRCSSSVRASIVAASANVCAVSVACSRRLLAWARTSSTKSNAASPCCSRIISPSRLPRRRISAPSWLGLSFIWDPLTLSHGKRVQNLILVHIYGVSLWSNMSILCNRVGCPCRRSGDCIIGFSEGESYRQVVFPLATEDMVVFYADGVTDRKHTRGAHC